MHVNIFFPHKYKDAKTGVLIGYCQREKNCYHVISVISFHLCSNKLSKLKFSSLSCETSEVLGLWLNQPDDCDVTLWNEIVSAEIKDYLVLRLQGPNLNVYFGGEKCNFMCYQKASVCFFDNEQILNSECLLPSIESYLLTCTKDQTSQDKLQNGDRFKTRVESLCDIVNTEMVFFLYTKAIEYNNKKRNEVYRSYSSWKIYLFLYLIWSKVAWIFIAIGNWMFYSLTLLCNPTVTRFVKLSSIGTHFLLKFKLLLKLFSPDCTQQVKYELTTAILCDIAIGLLFCTWLYSFPQVWFHTAEILMPSVDFISKQVEELIRWLMGIPIGLKLNSPLNQFLGKFFLHHVWFWLEYIQMILLAFTPGNVASLTWPLYITCFGFSFSIAIVSDVVSLLSFHVYCFYIYAARLYGLQIAGLMSFWRLFRGKKWNPLRMRVDTLPHSPDVANHRFFTGSLLFTILLFLLPTTALYYAIFAILRVTTICVQKPLHSLRMYFACFPWFALTQRIVQPQAFATHARFDRSSAFRVDDVPKSDDLPQAEFGVGRVRRVADVIAFDMSLDLLSYKDVVYSGLMRTAGDMPLFSHNAFRQLSTSLLSGKLLKWF